MTCIFVKRCFNSTGISYLLKTQYNALAACKKVSIRLESTHVPNATNAVTKVENLQPIISTLLAENKLDEKKKDINQLPIFMKKLQAILEKNEDSKHLLLGNYKKLKLSKTYISNKLATSFLENKERFVNKELEIVSLLEYLNYKNLKNIEHHFLKKYKTTAEPMPILLYNTFFKNYRQLLQSKNNKVNPNHLIKDIKALFEYKKWEIKEKFKGNTSVLSTDEGFLVEEMYSDILQQVILSLKFKNINSSITNKQTLNQLPSSIYGNALKLKDVNELISLFKESFGAVENRIVQTQMIQILGQFNKFEKQMEIFQHMKFLSVKKNSPDKNTYLNMLISKLKQKDLLGGMDLIDEYKQNMKVYYEKIYLDKLSLNQREKQQVPLLPIYFNDPDYFEKLDKLYKKLEFKHQLDLEQCDNYYIGVPIELRIMFIRLIISVCSNFKIDKGAGLTPESIMGYRFKAWDLLYGILLELPESEINLTKQSNNYETLVSSLICEDSTENQYKTLPDEFKIQVKPFFENIGSIDFNDPVVQKSLNTLNVNKSSTNERSTQIKKDFIKVCMEMSLFEKDVEFARCIYLKFFNEYVAPKLNSIKGDTKKSSDLKNILVEPSRIDFTNLFTFREREFWVQIYHSLLKTYYNNSFIRVNKTNSKSSVKKIMSLVNKQKKSDEELEAQRKLNSLKIYQVNPKTNWIRSKIMEEVGIEKGEFKQFGIEYNSNIKVPFLPTLTLNEDTELKLMEIKAIYDWHYFNVWNNLNNLKISKRLDGESLCDSMINVPASFKAELNAIIKSGDGKLLKFNIKSLLTKWFVNNCNVGLINPLLTQEGIILSYVSSPMKYEKNYQDFIKRLDKHCINISYLDNLITSLSTSNDDSLIEKMYLETFKVWKDDSIFIGQLQYSDTNSDINFMKRTWNERLSNRNYISIINSNLKQSYPLELTDSDKNFYKKYVKTQFENDLILESYEFVKSTCKYINYEYKDLKTMIDVLKELEDFNKVDYLKKIINQNIKNSFLKST
ncbi:hypothetical protein QEN19_001665 [Hanseniaspora menglaensis]